MAESKSKSNLKSDSKSGIRYEFVELMKRCRARHKSVRAFEAAIAEANASFERRTVDRRKLNTLLTTGDAKLCLWELEALDVYLNRKGRSLADEVFQKRRLIQAVGARGHVNLLIGGKGTDMGPEVSYWETKAMGRLIRRMRDAAPGASSDVENARVPSTRKAWDPDELRRRCETESWYADLHGSRGMATVSFGSSFANPASELMLADMLGCRAFDRDAFAGRPAPPFRFVWAPAAYEKRPSSFSENGGEVVLDRNGRGNGWETWAMRLSGSLETIDRNAEAWDHYGVLVAQKRRTGAVWVVAAGLTGPATYAAEALMNEYSIPLPAPEGASHGAPVWVAYKALVRKDEQATGDLVDGPLQPVVIPDENGHMVRRLPVVATA